VLCRAAADGACQSGRVHSFSPSAVLNAKKRMASRRREASRGARRREVSKDQSKAKACGRARELGVNEEDSSRLLSALGLCKALLARVAVAAVSAGAAVTLLASLARWSALATAAATLLLVQVEESVLHQRIGRSSAVCSTPVVLLGLDALSRVARVWFFWGLFGEVSVCSTHPETRWRESERVQLGRLWISRPPVTRLPVWQALQAASCSIRSHSYVVKRCRSDVAATGRQRFKPRNHLLSLAGITVAMSRARSAAMRSGAPFEPSSFMFSLPVLFEVT
jgi:hypothetical protein